MKIYLAIKYYADNSNKRQIEEICKHLNQQGHEVICVARDVERWGAKSFSPQELMNKSFEIIENSDLVLIEFSEKGVGLGIEAGYAYANKIPIITIAKKDSDISTTLSGISKNIIEYTSISDISL